MTNEIQIFRNEQFGQIRMLDKDGEPWFVLKDVCEAFGESNYRRVSGRLDDDEKGVSQIATPGGKQNMTIINESGLYSALFAMQPEKARGVDDEYIESRQKQLKAFKRWVTSEVLPSIRKHGQYTVDTERHENWEIAERNSRSREAALWLKIGETVGTETYKHICASYASKALAGNEVIPLPKSAQRHYTASEIGNMFGVSAHKIGAIAKANHLKTEVYGSWYHDKSPFSAKEVETFRYNNNAVERFREIFGS